MKSFNFFRNSSEDREKIWLKIRMILIAIAVGLAAVWAAGLSAERNRLEKEIAGHKKKLNGDELRAEKLKAQKLSEDMLKYRSEHKKLEAINRVISEKTDVLEIFREIDELVFEGISLSALSLGESSVEIEGHSDSDENIALFEHRLRKSRIGAAVNIDEIRREGKIYSFKMEMSMLGGSRVETSWE